jgi:superfamily II DNA or RNA helicase
MKLSIETPTKAFISEATQAEMDILTQELTYTHLGNQHLYKRLLDNFWFRSKNPMKWQESLEELKKKLKFTLIFEENGRKFIRPGSVHYLIGKLNLDVENKIVYPKIKPITWHKPLPFELTPAQKGAWELLLEELHGNISFATGVGKTAIILKLAKEIGLNLAIIVPSKSIFLEVSKLFEYHFGKNSGGYFGNGKKKIGKQFTVCISDSIVNIKPDSRMEIL